MASLETSEQEKGMKIFLDVFRRADKNDDGFISWEEFISYFADGVVGKEELESLFNEIDTHNTHNIDTGELCAYFSQHLGEFKEVFGMLEDLNKSITDVLFSISKAHDAADHRKKFVTRFLLQEVISQISALQRPLEAASESVDNKARAEMGEGVAPLKPEDLLKKGDGPSVIPGRVVRRAKRQVSSQSASSDVSELVEKGISPALSAQVERLASLIEHLETKINFDGFRDEEVIPGEDTTLLLVQREFVSKENKIEEFRAQLRSYVDVTQGFNGCLNISVRDLRATNTFSVYEIWSTEELYIQNCDSAATKTLYQTSAELLERPETVHSMKIPITWWRGQA
ncbi:N-terminal EF-hand calcium-binding protein 1-like isoform X1 [Pomacea canaliculata]|uniref:N-terminal EF-hand calcium-binding protein 1-like isoform X1 n=1 Tax=Pomacea canaliculata TaxID=400727 RepID=UPI000D731769|nr:N-terminal EF-hand calcium-binding protein 1-like isoform X1 [Pomacea canaliculata]